MEAEENPVEKDGVTNWKLLFLIVSSSSHFVFDVMGLHFLYFYQNEDDYHFYHWAVMFYLLSAVIKFGVSSNLLQRYDSERKLYLYLFILFIIVNTCLIFTQKIGNHIYEVAVADVPVIMFKYSLYSISFFVALQLRTFKVYVTPLYYAMKAKLAQRKQNEEEEQLYFALMIEREVDVGLLGLLDGCQKAVPVQILQIAVFIKSGCNPHSLSIIQEISVFMSFFLIPWCLTSYQSAFRESNPEKKTMKINNKVIYYCSHFWIIIPRTLCIGAAAAVFPLYTLGVATLHIAGWATWLWWYHKPLQLYNYNKYYHIIYCAIFGISYFTVPIKLDDIPTKSVRYVFYAIMICENSLGLSLWFIDSYNSPCGICVLISNLLCFILALGCYNFYYTRCHPNLVYRKRPRPEEDETGCLNTEICT